VIAATVDPSNRNKHCENTVSIRNLLFASGAKRFVERSMGELKVGRLDMILPGGECIVRQGAQEGLHGVLEIKRWRTFTAILRRGDIGFAEAYIKGDWDTPDLSALMTVLASNVDTFNDDFGARGIDRIMTSVQHFMRRNSKKQSRKNIEAHYDLGNTFYELWLDPTMTYSSGIFNEGTAELETAQRTKYQRILDQAELEPNSHILEVGCGWGGFAEVAAEAGHRVTGITISPAQLDYAKRRLAPQINDGAVELTLTDYRDLNGSFDAIASIEMFEAVGTEWWSAYMQTLKRNLKPGGKAVVQSIDIRDDLFEGYNSQADFIQTYIFPGGLIPSPERFRAAAAQDGLECLDSHHFGLSYAKTLRDWQTNFNAVEDNVRHLGFDTEFIRLWNFYYSYCIGGFEAGRTGVGQHTLRVA
jgi:cyclopropane-fatty-acyl-phospholipid synthase